MTGTRRLLFVVGCLCCLFVAASALPAADPRLEGPGQADGEPVAGDWESVDGTPDLVTNASEDPDDANEVDDSNDASEPEEIEIDGPVEPGSVVTVDTASGGWNDRKTVAVNGANVSETDRFGTANVTVPYAEEMTVSIPEDDRSRTVDIPTVASIETHGGAAPDRDLEFSVTVGSTPVSDATVTLDGETVATTDEDGDATVTMPETAGPVDLRVERGPVTGERTVDVGEPTVSFVSPLVFPGAPTPVQVSADGDGVPNARVTLEDGGSATTDEDGRAHLWLPIDDEATATVELGSETATATVGNLYLRLTAVVVFVPGFLIGAVLTYLRLVAANERRSRNGWSGAFLSLADVFAEISDAVTGLLSALVGRNGPALSVPAVSLPTLSLSLPHLQFDGFGRGFPSLGSAISFGGLPSLGSAVSFGGLPSLGSLRSRDRSSTGGGSLLEGLFGTRDDESEPSTAATDAGPELADEPLAPRGPHAEVRAAWHTFLDRLGVEDRTTTTPGAVARTALAAGFPSDRVDRLVAIVRDIEYGGREPSPDRVAEVRATVRELIERDSDEEGST